MPRSEKKPECGLQYYCDRRRGNYCCADCGLKCRNRCQNTPKKCGQYIKGGEKA